MKPTFAAFCFLCHITCHIFVLPSFGQLECTSYSFCNIFQVLRLQAFSNYISFQKVVVFVHIIIWLIRDAVFIHSSIDNSCLSAPLLGKHKGAIDTYFWLMFHHLFSIFVVSMCAVHFPTKFGLAKSGSKFLLRRDFELVTLIDVLQPAPTSILLPDIEDFVVITLKNINFCALIRAHVVFIQFQV